MIIVFTGHLCYIIHGALEAPHLREETATNELIHIQWQLVLIPLPRVGFWKFWKKFSFLFQFVSGYA